MPCEQRASFSLQCGHGARASLRGPGSERHWEGSILAAQFRVPQLCCTLGSPGKCQKSQCQATASPRTRWIQLQCPGAGWVHWPRQQSVSDFGSGRLPLPASHYRPFSKCTLIAVQAPITVQNKLTAYNNEGLCLLLISDTKSSLLNQTTVGKPAIPGRNIYRRWW